MPRTTAWFKMMINPDFSFFLQRTWLLFTLSPTHFKVNNTPTQHTVQFAISLPPATFLPYCHPPPVPVKVSVLWSILSVRVCVQSAAQRVRAIPFQLSILAKPDMSRLSFKYKSSLLALIQKQWMSLETHTRINARTYKSPGACFLWSGSYSTIHSAAGVRQQSGVCVYVSSAIWPFSC